MDVLKNQYPMFILNTLFGANISFPVTEPSYIQTLHIHNNHWITVEAVTVILGVCIRAAICICALILDKLSYTRTNLTYNKTYFKWVPQIVVCFQWLTL